MKIVTTPVRHKGQHVGDVEVPVYDTLEEIVEAHKETEIVELFNKQLKVQLQGKLRAKNSEASAGTKKALRQKAFNLLTNDEVAQYAGDFEGLSEFLTSPEMVARVEAAENGEG